MFIPTGISNAGARAWSWLEGAVAQGVGADKYHKILQDLGWGYRHQVEHDDVRLTSQVLGTAKAWNLADRSLLIPEDVHWKTIELFEREYGYDISVKIEEVDTKRVYWTNPKLVQSDRVLSLDDLEDYSKALLERYPGKKYLDVKLVAAWQRD